MLEIKKQKQNGETPNFSVHHHPEFIELKKPVPIQKKNPLPSLKWLDDLVDFLSDFFT
jgi:hypothetical protein